MGARRRRFAHGRSCTKQRWWGCMNKDAARGVKGAERSADVHAGGHTGSARRQKRRARDDTTLIISVAASALGIDDSLGIVPTILFHQVCMCSGLVQNVLAVAREFSRRESSAVLVRCSIASDNACSAPTCTRPMPSCSSMRSSMQKCTCASWGDTAHESESIRTRTDRIHAVVLAGTVVEAVSHAPVDEASFGSLRRGLADTSSGHTDRMPARRQRPGGGRRRRDSLGDSSASN